MLAIVTIWDCARIRLQPGLRPSLSLREVRWRKKGNHTSSGVALRGSWPLIFESNLRPRYLYLAMAKRVENRGQDLVSSALQTLNNSFSRAKTFRNGSQMPFLDGVV